VQVEAPALEVVPELQVEQTVAEAAEYVPAAQAPVTAVSLVVAQYDPSGHEVHVVDPIDA